MRASLARSLLPGRYDEKSFHEVSTRPAASGREGRGGLGILQSAQCLQDLLLRPHALPPGAAA